MEVHLCLIQIYISMMVMEFVEIIQLKKLEINAINFSKILNKEKTLSDATYI